MYKIIIVEDEWLVREGLKQTIPWSNLGCEVAGEAEDGEEALELIERVLPDIMLSDIRMPTMNGIELAGRLTESHPHISIVFLTGFDDFAYAQQALRLGAVDYVLKPTNPDELEKVIRRITAKLDQERGRQQLAEQQDRRWADGRPVVAGLDKRESRESREFQQIMDYLLVHFHEDLPLQSMADRMNVSESYFSRLFKKHVGVSFLEYITNLRVQAAKELLADPRFKMYEIAERVGYQDARYFSQIFRKSTGETPSEYRKRLGIVSV
ncbi:response regulator [Paenibacillus sp. MBLB4367]|uniref:response regulator n=1 Tax=Paenibacillus sp. MBLB4367 TaxID=3384767 RepID=UPI003907FD31